MMLSVVLALHQQARSLPTIARGVDRLRYALPYPVEVVVVDAGSTDGTARLAERAGYTVIRRADREPGAAVRAGMMAASGVYRLLAEPHWSVPPEQVQLLLPPVLTGFDVAIGSRYLPGSIRHGEPRLAEMMSRLFNRLVQGVILPDVVDSQCTYRVFRAEAAQVVFSRARESGWGVGVESLAIARRFGMELREVPIDWTFHPNAGPRLSDGPDLMAAVLRVRTRLAAGVYPPLAAVQSPADDDAQPSI